MKDFLGNELSINDIVICPRPQYRDLMRGRVIGFTPKKVRIEYFVTWSKNVLDSYLIEPEFNVIKEPNQNGYGVEFVRKAEGARKVYD